MKNIILIIAMMISTVAFGGTANKGKSVAFDAQNSKVNWKGTKVTGEHVGTINVQGGNLVVAAGELKGGEITIDMTSIQSTDLSGEWKDKLDGHLKNEDFFDTSKFKTSSFKVTKVEKKGKDTFNVTGDLTIKGTTKPVSTELKLVEKSGKYHLQGALTFDRTAYDIRYGSGKFFDNLGDKMIHDKVELKLDLASK
jgi:polyisoprenoid-binding protein YceI